MNLEAIPRCIDRLATHYAGLPAAGEIERAREAFDAARGKVYDDDELHQAHMSLFLEWYVLERPGMDGLTPVEHALTTGDGVVGEDRDLLVALTRSQHGLFELFKLDPGAAHLFDLFLGGRWRVESASRLTGLEPGDILEARLVPWEGAVRFGPSFCFHPRPARESIHAMLDRAAEQGRLDPRMIGALAEMRLRYSRFRNIAVEHIYTPAPFGVAQPEPRP